MAAVDVKASERLISGVGGGREREGEGRRRLMSRSSREASAATSFCARADMLMLGEVGSLYDSICQRRQAKES